MEFVRGVGCCWCVFVGVIGGGGKTDQGEFRLIRVVLWLFLVSVFCSLKQHINTILKLQGPVVQSIVSLTSSLRGQLVKCFTTL